MSASPQSASSTAWTYAVIDSIPCATGEYSSETLATWHAVGARSISDGACVYSAGDQVTPHGSFTLTLANFTGQASFQTGSQQGVKACSFHGRQFGPSRFRHTSQNALSRTCAVVGTSARAPMPPLCDGGHENLPVGGH